MGVPPLRLNRILQDYDIGFRHNPKQFYPNSFRVEMEERRLVLVAVAKKHLGKRFRIVGVVKERRK